MKINDCPFCGEMAISELVFERGDSTWFAVECTYGACMRGPCSLDEEHAIKLWNRIRVENETI